jgi:hypothetical protein
MRRIIDLSRVVSRWRRPIEIHAVPSLSLTRSPNYRMYDGGVST